MSNKGYIKKSREYVLKSLKKLGKWQTALDVCNYGQKHYGRDVPSTEYSHATPPNTNRSGGWTVWDWTDRVKRALDYMVKRGLVEKREKDNKKPEYRFKK